MEHTTTRRYVTVRQVWTWVAIWVIVDVIAHAWLLGYDADHVLTRIFAVIMFAVTLTFVGETNWNSRKSHSPPAL